LLLVREIDFSPTLVVVLVADFDPEDFENNFAENFNDEIDDLLASFGCFEKHPDTMRRKLPVPEPPLHVQPEPEKKFVNYRRHNECA
jgi:hypothetical protein